VTLPICSVLEIDGGRINASRGTSISPGSGVHCTSHLGRTCPVPARRGRQRQAPRSVHDDVGRGSRSTGPESLTSRADGASDLADVDDVHVRVSHMPRARPQRLPKPIRHQAPLVPRPAMSSLSQGLGQADTDCDYRAVWSGGLVDHPHIKHLRAVRRGSQVAPQQRDTGRVATLSMALTCLVWER
jgi:hypothetical protein